MWPSLSDLTIWYRRARRVPQSVIITLDSYVGLGLCLAVMTCRSSAYCLVRVARRSTDPIRRPGIDARETIVSMAVLVKQPFESGSYADSSQPVLFPCDVCMTSYCVHFLWLAWVVAFTRVVNICDSNRSNRDNYHFTFPTLSTSPTYCVHDTPTGYCRKPS